MVNRRAFFHTVGATAAGALIARQAEWVHAAPLQQGRRNDAAMSGQIPLERLGSVQDVANAVAFLASEQAAYITGQVLVVDGGLVM